ncbi:MAG: protease complex subunit PrcB family protein [Armatimonadota bacterium]
MKYFVWAMALWMALLLIGCDEGDEELAGQQVPAFTEYKGQQGPFPDRGFFVIQNQDAWNALWAGRQAPTVNFTQNSVLVALMGQQPTAGYNITITDVRATGTDVVAYVDETRPRPGDPVAQVITFPYHMVVVPKLTQPVAFRIEGTNQQPVVVQNLFNGQYSQAVNPQTRVIRTAAEWQTFWTSTFGTTQPVPQIDFTRNMAAVVLIGQRPTAGYNVLITGADDVANRIEVRYRVTSPNPGDPVAQVITSPYSIAILPASNQAVAFRPVTTVVAATP